MSLLASLGKNIPLTAQLVDDGAGYTDLVVFANIYDDQDVLTDIVELQEVEFGYYTNLASPFQMPDSTFISVIYDVFVFEDPDLFETDYFTTKEIFQLTEELNIGTSGGGGGSAGQKIIWTIKQNDLKAAMSNKELHKKLKADVVKAMVDSDATHAVIQSDDTSGKVDC